jgi:hypothetical protein
VSGTVGLAASAGDGGGSGVALVEFLVDGDVVGSDASAPYGFDWNSATTADGPHVLRARAVDAAGNVASSTAVSVTVNNAPPPPPPDITAPTSSIACNAAACGTGWYRDSALVSLAAADDVGGSGLKEIRYTTDGSDPTAASGTVYAGPISLSSTKTVKYRAFDNAGNAEAVRSQLVQVDATAPTVSVTAPVNGTTVTGNVKITANASDAASGVASVTFFVDGVRLAAVTAAPYTTPWNTKKVTGGQHTLTAVAEDRTGHTTTSVAVTVTVR